MLKDCDIRNIFIEELKKNNPQYDLRIIEEMAVCDGDARVDIAVINDILHGYEIKSDADTLERLSLQQKCYDRTFDKISIIVGEKFKDKIDSYIPEHWGIFVITKNNNKFKIRRKRPAKINKNIDASALLELLWKEEIVSLLKNAGIKGLSGKNRRILRKIAEENISLIQIKDFTRKTLKNRKNWRI